jgi:hypothetical protein
MSKFDFMNFENDGLFEFIAHAKKYTKEEAVAVCKSENEDVIKNNEVREITAEDIQERFVRFFIHAPEGLNQEFPDGCYSYCSKFNKGCFPVWVIDLAALYFTQQEVDK